jgi:hypothetical protein
MFKKTAGELVSIGRETSGYSHAEAESNKIGGTPFLSDPSRGGRGQTVQQPAEPDCQTIKLRTLVRLQAVSRVWPTGGGVSHQDWQRIVHCLTQAVVEIVSQPAIGLRPITHDVSQASQEQEGMEARRFGLGRVQLFQTRRSSCQTGPRHAVRGMHRARLYRRTAPSLKPKLTRGPSSCASSNVAGHPMPWLHFAQHRAVVFAAHFSGAAARMKMAATGRR